VSIGSNLEQFSLELRMFLYNRPVIVAYLGIAAEPRFNNLRSINLGMCCDPDWLHQILANLLSDRQPGHG
jgi:hypothetical protein